MCIYIYIHTVNFQFPAYPYASCQGGLVYMPHVRHSIQWVCNPVPVATLKAQARGLLQQVWSRKKPLAALGADWCSSHRRGHYWKNPIGCWFRGPFYITVIRVVNYFRTTSDIGILLDPFSSLPLWSIHIGSGATSSLGFRQWIRRSNNFSDCTWEFFSTKWSSFHLATS